MQLENRNWQGLDVYDNKIYTLENTQDKFYRFYSPRNATPEIRRTASSGRDLHAVSVTSEGIVTLDSVNLVIGRLVRYSDWGDDTIEVRELPHGKWRALETVVTMSSIPYPSEVYEGIAAPRDGGEAIYVVDNRRKQLLRYASWDDATPEYRDLPHYTTHDAWVGLSATSKGLFAYNDANRRVHRFDDWDDTTPQLHEYALHNVSGYSSDQSGQHWALYPGSIIFHYQPGRFISKPLPNGRLYTGLHVQGNGDVIYVLDDLNNQILRYPMSGTGNAFNDTDPDVKDLPDGAWRGITVSANCILVLDSTPTKERIGRDCNWDAD